MSIYRLIKTLLCVYTEITNYFASTPMRQLNNYIATCHYRMHVRASMKNTITEQKYIESILYNQWHNQLIYLPHQESYEWNLNKISRNRQIITIPLILLVYMIAFRFSNPSTFSKTDTMQYIAYSTTKTYIFITFTKSYKFF